MEDDSVMFSRKEPPKENNVPARRPKYVTKKEIEKQAKRGESYKGVAESLKSVKARLRWLE